MNHQGTILFLVFSLAVLGSVHLVLLLKVRVARALKVAAIVSMSALYIGTFYWTEGLLGWSAPVAMPDRFKVLWTRVIEPNALTGHPGAIHLWVEELNDRNIPSGEPRAYLVPYSRSLARKATTAQSEIKKGRAQGGTANAFIPSFVAQPEGANVRTATQGAAPGGDPSGGGVLDPSALGGQSSTVNLIPLPPPLLPAKDGP